MEILEQAEKEGLLNIEKKELTPKGNKELMDLIDGVTDAIVESPHMSIKGTEEQFREATRNIFLTMFGSTYETFLYLYPHRFDFSSLVDFHLQNNGGELQ